MGYAIVSQIKIHSKGAFNGIQAHNRRETNAKNIHKEHSHKNITLVPSPYKNFDDFVEKKRSQIREANKKNGTKNRMLQKNKKGKYKGEYKSMMQELVFTHSRDDLTEEESIEYCKRALEFVKEFYPELEIVYAEIHLDEATPHIHIGVAYFNVHQCKFVQKAVQSTGRTDFDTIRNAWQEYNKDTEFAKLKKQDGSVVGNKHDGSKANTHIAELKKQNAELAAEAFTTKKVKAKFGKKTIIKNKQVSYKELYLQSKAELAKKTEEQGKEQGAVALAEEQTPTVQTVEVEKIVEVEKVVEKIVYREDTVELEALKSKLAIQSVALDTKDAQIADLKQKLKELPAKILNAVKKFMGGVKIEDVTKAESAIKSELQDTNELLLQDNPGMTR